MIIDFNKASWSITALEHSTHGIRFSVEYRVPRKGELYFNKRGEMQRCGDKNYSNHAQRRVVIRKWWFSS
jgi:hypothetical protein